MNPSAPQIERLLDEMIGAQRRRLLELASRIAPGIPDDGLLQPHDHPVLAVHPGFNFEDGILAGYLTVRAGPPPPSRRPARQPRQPVEDPAASPPGAFPAGQARDRFGMLRDPFCVPGAQADLPELAAVLARELSENFFEGAHAERPAAASSVETVESQLNRERLRRPFSPIFASASGFSQAIRSAAPSASARAGTTKPVSPSRTNSRGPPASSVVRTAFPDRKASSGTSPRSSPTGVTTTRRARA